MSESSLYGGVTNRRITIRDLQTAKDRGERWPMLTAYDYSTARVFDEISAGFDAEHLAGCGNAAAAHFYPCPAQSVEEVSPRGPLPQRQAQGFEALAQRGDRVEPHTADVPFAKVHDRQGIEHVIELGGREVDVEFLRPAHSGGMLEIADAVLVEHHAPDRKAALGLARDAGCDGHDAVFERPGRVLAVVLDVQAVES